MDFKFETKNHSYTLDGKPLTGCTTILGVIAKPALIQWAASEAVKFVGEEWKPDVTYSAEAIKIILDKAKTVHRRKKEEAGQKGTDVHAIIEDIIKFAIEKDEGQVMMNTHEIPQVRNFIEWAMDLKIKFLESEKKVYSAKHWVAGTADFTCLIDGRKYIGDIKTSSGIYDRTPMAQTAAYRMMLEELGEKDFVGSVIVNIKKDGNFDKEKDVYWSEDFQEDLRLFMGALEVYRVLNSTIIIKINKKNESS